jgi:hypothetical protein
LARDARKHAEHAQHGFAHGNFAEVFSDAGQESLNRVVNQMLATLETIAADRLGRVLAIRTGTALNAADIQGAASGLSADIPLTWLSTSQRLYLGHEGMGLGALVSRVAPAVETSVRAAFARATAALSSLPKHLENADASHAAALQAAIRAAKELEVAIKVDLASALGISLNFISSDGD